MIRQRPPGRTTVALYVRVSTEEQAQDGFSIAGQLEKLQLACQLHDWASLPPYIDDGYSGKDMGRPAMKRLMEDAAKAELSARAQALESDTIQAGLIGDVLSGFGQDLETFSLGQKRI